MKGFKLIFILGLRRMFMGNGGTRLVLLWIACMMVTLVGGMRGALAQAGVPTPCFSAPAAPLVKAEPAPLAPAAPLVKAEPAPSAPAAPLVKADPAPSAPAAPSVKADPAPSAPAAPLVKAEPAPSAPTAPSVKEDPAPLAPAAPSPSPAAPAPTPSPRANPLLRFDFSTYYARSEYNNTGAADIQAAYLQYRLDRRSRVYLGHQHYRYSDQRTFRNGVTLDTNNVGAHLWLDRKNGFQADYFSVRGRPGGWGNVYGLEYLRALGKGTVVGLGVVSSRYPLMRIVQIAPRLVITPIPDLSLQTRVIYTHATGAGRNARIAVAERVSWSPSPQWTVRGGGLLGSAWRLVDTDNLNIYPQQQAMTGSVFASVHYDPDPHVRFFVHYERAWFQGYLTNVYVGGLSGRW